MSNYDYQRVTKCFLPWIEGRIRDQCWWRVDGLVWCDKDNSATMATREKPLGVGLGEGGGPTGCGLC